MFVSSGLIEDVQALYRNRLFGAQGTESLPDHSFTLLCRVNTCMMNPMVSSFASDSFGRQSTEPCEYDYSEYNRMQS